MIISFHSCHLMCKKPWLGSIHLPLGKEHIYVCKLWKLFHPGMPLLFWEIHVFFPVFVKDLKNWYNSEVEIKTLCVCKVSSCGIILNNKVSLGHVPKILFICPEGKKMDKHLRNVLDETKLMISSRLCWIYVRMS